MEYIKQPKHAKTWCGVSEKTMIKLVDKIFKLTVMHAMFIREYNKAENKSSCRLIEMMNIERDIMWHSYKHCIDYGTFRKTFDVTIDVMMMMKFVKMPLQSDRQLFDIVKERWCLLYD